MKNHKLALLLLLAQSSWVSASTINIDISGNPFQINDMITATISGDFAVGAGSFDISYDPAILNNPIVTLDPSVTTGALAFPGLVSTGTVDDNAGTITGIRFFNTGGAAGAVNPFTLGTIKFTAEADGVSAIALTIPDNLPFNDGVNDIDSSTITINNASVTVSAVPVPAAIWLFGSAIAGFTVVGRKRTSGAK